MRFDSEWHQFGAAGGAAGHDPSLVQAAEEVVAAAQKTECGFKRWSRSSSSAVVLIFVGPRKQRDRWTRTLTIFCRAAKSSSREYAVLLLLFIFDMRSKGLFATWPP